MASLISCYDSYNYGSDNNKNNNYGNQYHSSQSNFNNSYNNNAYPPMAFATPSSSPVEPKHQVQVDFVPNLQPLSPSEASISASSSFSTLSQSGSAADDWLAASFNAATQSSPPTPPAPTASTRPPTPTTTSTARTTNKSLPMKTTQVVASSNRKNNHRNNFNNNGQIYVPRSTNPLRTDGVHPDKLKMKAQRKKKIASGTVTGAVVGGLVLGPVGIFLGGATAGLVTKRVCKAGESKKQRKFEKKNVQRAALRSTAAKSGYMT